MELALSAIPAALGLGGAGAATAGALAGSASLLSTLSGIGTIVGIIGTLGKGFSDAAESRQEADQATLQAGQEQVAGAQRQLDMKRQLLKVLGENDVAFAAGGTDVTAGIAADARAKATQDAVTQLSIDREDTDFRAAMLRARASNLRSKASGQIGGALLGALGQGIDYRIGQIQRGGSTSSYSGGELGGYGSSY